MSGSIFERERFRPQAAPTTVAAPGRFQERAGPVRRPDPVAPTGPSRTPQRPSPSNDLMGLAAALTSLSPALQGFANAYFEGERRTDGAEADAEATQLALRQQDIVNWAGAIRQNPALADRSPYYRQVFESRLAQQAVLRRGNQLHGEYWNSEIAGSADPAAIQGWLSERMRDVLEQFKDSPAQRMAAAEAVREQAQSLVRTHQQNAVRNLVAQNEDSLSAAITGLLDTHATRGGGAARADATFAVPDNIRRIYERVAQEEGLPAHILMAQGYHESGGFSADVLSGRRRGSVGEIGLAQVRPETAAQPGYGVAPINEQGLLDPEQAIRFQARYLKARGTAAGVRDWNDPQQQLIGLAAYNGTGEQAQGYARTVQSLAGQATGSTSGPGAGNGPSPGALLGRLQQIEAEARAQGVDGRRINAILTEAVAAAAVKHGRADYLTLGDIDRPDGTPGFGRTGAGVAAMERARNTILSNSVQRDNAEWQQYMRNRTMAGDMLASQVAGTLIDQLAAGQSPQLTPDQLRLAARIDPDLVTKVTGLASALRGTQQQENTRDVALLEMQVNQGEVTERDVLGFIGTTLRDPQTIQRIMSKAREVQSSDSVFRNPLITQLVRETQEAAAGMEANGVLKNHGIGVAVGNAMREEAAKFQQANPQASQLDILEHLRKRQAELIQRFNPSVQLPGYDRAAAPGSTAPIPGRREEAQSQLPQPNASTNLRTVTVFSSQADLDAALARWVASPGDPSNPLFQWAQAQPSKSVRQIYDDQRAALRRQAQQQTR